MGQDLSSCAPCCSKSAQEIEAPYQMADLNDNGTNPQWKEKIRTHQDKIVFAVDPKSSEEEIAAKRMESLTSNDPNANAGGGGVVSNDKFHNISRNFKLEDVEMIKTIGTGTFARVYLCRPKAHLNRSNSDYFALKILAMHDVIRLKQVDHVKNEKNILSEIHHPFIVDLLWFHKDKNLLYMLFPYVCGGELFSYLRRLL